MMYALARFNAWVSACGFESAEQMRAARRNDQYFTEQDRKMLEENLDDYATNSIEYIKVNK